MEQILVVEMVLMMEIKMDTHSGLKLVGLLDQ